MYNCINLIKISILKNKKGFIINNNKKNLSLIKAFIKINVIKFIIIKNNYIIVNINYINNKPVFKNIINVFKPSNKMFISAKKLEKLNNKHNWIFILSTNKGLVNSFDALNLKIGGLILAKIWN